MPNCSAKPSRLWSPRRLSARARVASSMTAACTLVRPSGAGSASIASPRACALITVSELIAGMNFTCRPRAANRPSWRATKKPAESAAGTTATFRCARRGAGAGAEVEGMNRISACISACGLKKGCADMPGRVRGPPSRVPCTLGAYQPPASGSGSAYGSFARYASGLVASISARAWLTAGADGSPSGRAGVGYPRSPGSATSTSCVACPESP